MEGETVPGVEPVSEDNGSASLNNRTPVSSNVSRIAHILKATSAGIPIHVYIPGEFNQRALLKSTIATT